MSKVIAAMNMTLDGFCDHTSGVPDAAVHQHYADLLRSAGTVLYGRITYRLMEYWRAVLENPTGDKAMDDFAAAIDQTPKLVFSRTMKNPDPAGIGWKSAKWASQDLDKEVLQLRQKAGKDVFVCSPSLIVALTKLNLIDEYQLCIHPVIAGSGLPLFKNISDKVLLKLIKTKTFTCGAVILYYEPLSKPASF